MPEKPMKPRPSPVVLCILDGWGYREARDGNAIAQARTPVFDRLLAENPWALLKTSAVDVGLPTGQMGNSEVGHTNLGAGRVVVQDLPRIDAAISDGTLAAGPALKDVTATCKGATGRCHLLGLVSDGGVHSHLNHIVALAGVLSAAGLKVDIHAVLDGRDTAPRSAPEFVAALEQAIADDANVRIATVSGRYYAMDRDNRWDRVGLAYDTLVDAKGPRAETAARVVETAYEAGTTDEFVLPTVVGDYAGMQDGDGLVVANFRADRVRQILSALLVDDFAEFDRARRPAFCAATGLTAYSSTLDAVMTAVFPPLDIADTLGEVISKAGLTQLRIAETEKYAHVTFFFNGGEEQVFAGEERILVPSPHVATYDLQPEMSAGAVTDNLVKAIADQRFDMIVCNYANTDMVGHTGMLQPAIAAVEAVDASLGRIELAVKEAGGVLLITADHGNAERMSNESGGVHTAHTTDDVPFIVVNAPDVARVVAGRLCDVAPTILSVLGLPQPDAMTGVSLAVNDGATTTTSDSVRVEA
jgi:2,3-bisphosphoglycerate-independent phosphoglycerate mutase